MKFIHCSDLHLDSPMESNLPYEKARERSAELLQTFRALTIYAKEHSVTAVLLCGDVFDSRRVCPATLDFFLSAISRAPDTDFLLLRGNHDQDLNLFTGRDLPRNLKFFTEKLTAYDYDYVTVTGTELSENNCLTFYDSLSLDQSRTNILMLHGQVSTQPGEELVCLPKLKGRHIDYLALGHLHSYRQETLEPGSTWCYSGCLEGRGFDECGEKGFVLLDVEKKSVKTSFIPFAFRTLYEVPVDITGLTGVSEILAAAEEGSKDIPSRSLVKFTLTGTCDLNTQKDLSFLKTAMSPSFYFVKCQDQSRLFLDPQRFQNDISLKGEFIRLILEEAPDQADQIITAGLQALSGEEITL